MQGGCVLEGAGVLVSALIMGNRLGGLTVTISIEGAIMFIVDSLNYQEFSSMEGTVSREVCS